ncbi:hypothetical protein PV327_010997 [Microctonus hyperodae]|uniref:Uncharacterized protein n=1 Tax=Microctonus hyperodae TaxID=165561 RepID=A0AA39KUJ7_MICHY|nr:hypothetical protein PV327_010997 [Microctonus hyperodae]
MNTKVPSSSSSMSASNEDLFKDAIGIGNAKSKKELLLEQLKKVALEEAAMLEEMKNMEEVVPSKAKVLTKQNDNEELPETKAKASANPDVKEDQSAVEGAIKKSIVEPMYWNEAKARQVEMRSFRPPLKSSRGASSSTKVQENSPSSEAMKLIKELRNRTPPGIKLGPTIRVTPAQIHAENLKRNRIPNKPKEVEKLKRTDHPRLTTDDPNAKLAPSTAVPPSEYKPRPFIQDLQELGLESEIYQKSQRPLYYWEGLMLSEHAMKDLIYKRSEMLLACKDSKLRTIGTQTYVSQAGKLRVMGCVNCRSRTHHARDFQLPYRPGFCRICFADGFDTEDSIYPHGIEHEAALGLCEGCGGEKSLYCPECPDCNVRYKDIVGWLRLNYVTWPTWAFPVDHGYLVNEGTETLKRCVKAKFNYLNDAANRAREFLIRENALTFAPVVQSREVPTIRQLTEEKLQLALNALVHLLTKKTMDEIMKERPELDDGTEIKTLEPTKSKYRAKKY